MVCRQSQCRTPLLGLTARRLSNFVLLLGLLLAAAGCAQRHVARLRPPSGVPAPRPAVLHTGRLWIDVRAATPDSQCVKGDGKRRLCFTDVRRAIGEALEQRLWPSFPEVRVRTKSDSLSPGDYVLLVDLSLDVMKPGPESAGWAARGRLEWRLVRDGFPIAAATLESRSPALFPYGSSLGLGASELVDALSLETAMSLGSMPESRPLPERALPAVTIVDGFAPSQNAVADSHEQNRATAPIRAVTESRSDVESADAPLDHATAPPGEDPHASAPRPNGSERTDSLDPPEIVKLGDAPTPVEP